MKEILFIFVLLVDMTFGSCPVRWTEADGSCWFVSREKKSWAEASATCQAFKAELAVIPDQQVQLGVESLIAGKLDTEFWLDGTDIILENDWMWASRREEIKFKNYQNLYGPVHNSYGHNCLYMDKKSSYRWEAGDCNEARDFICQSPISVSVNPVG